MDWNEDLEEVIENFRRVFFMPDPSALEVTMAAYVANRLDGDPLWLMLIGGPSSGKNEILDSLQNLPKIRYVATLTEAGLLSGTKESERGDGAKGGVLAEIGNFGILIPRDFTSVLSMGRDAQMKLFAALREIHSGSWTRDLGTDGGRRFNWKGKIGFIGGVTGEIDSHQEALNKMGARFIFHRMPGVDPAKQARRALQHGGKEQKIRLQLATCVSSFLFNLFDQIKSRNKDPQPMAPDIEDWLVPLATLVCASRSTVTRQGSSHEIQNVHVPESPGRLVKDLAKLHCGIEIIGGSPDRARQLTIKTGMDSLPPIRRKLLEQLIKSPGRIKIDPLAKVVSLPASTVRRALEDLACHNVVESERTALSDFWSIAPYWSEQCRVLFPKPK